jgi:hypothetical protein
MGGIVLNRCVSRALSIASRIKARGSRNAVRPLNNRRARPHNHDPTRHMIVAAPSQVNPPGPPE